MRIYILTIYLTCIFLSIQGLLDALEDLMPGLEHRFCVRHLHANFKGMEFKGKEFKYDCGVQLGHQMKFSSSTTSL
jgi:hypothetical protein